MQASLIHKGDPQKKERKNGKNQIEKENKLSEEIGESKDNLWEIIKKRGLPNHFSPIRVIAGNICIGKTTSIQGLESFIRMKEQKIHDQEKKDVNPFFFIYT